MSCCYSRNDGLPCRCGVNAPDGGHYDCVGPMGPTGPTWQSGGDPVADLLAAIDGAHSEPERFELVLTPHDLDLLLAIAASIRGRRQRVATSKGARRGSRG